MIQSVNLPLVFCDVETTGGHPKKHRVTELACIRYEDGVEVARIDTQRQRHRWVAQRPRVTYVDITSIQTIS